MADLKDQIILVTGATSGIGKVAARTLAQQGAYVVLLARNAEKAEATRQEIVEAAGHDRVGILLCDLSDLGQVRYAADTFRRTYSHLDVLVNNAGLIFGDARETSPDGYEMTLATNHLGPFLLTSLLLPELRKSPAARIVNVASMAYKFAKPDFGSLEVKGSYAPMRAYANSKLYNIMFTQELARRLRTHGITNVTTNVLHPGVVASSFGSNSTWFTRAFYALAAPFMTSSEDGAQTSIFLASSPEVAQVSGGYFVKKKAQAVKTPYNTPHNARQLWERSEQLTDTQFLNG